MGACGVCGFRRVVGGVGGSVWWEVGGDGGGVWEVVAEGGLWVGEGGGGDVFVGECEFGWVFG